SISYYFFFQAEDGIRDRNVTGVQTCALPISGSTDTLGVGQGDVFSFSGFVFFNSDQRWHTTAGLEFATHNVAWTFWCDHGYVNTGWGLNVFVADVESVSEE